MSDRRIGILGGVFDPVHCGHLAAAVMAKEEFGLGRVIFIPSGMPPHKSSVTASCDDRLNMLKLALDDMGCGFDVWEGEIRREGYSYTIDTVKELREVHGDDVEIYFIIGADNLADIPKWHSYEDIVKMVTVCVVERPGYEFDGCLEALGAAAKIKTFPGPLWGLSSTVLREYLRDGRSCKYLIPDAALGYIGEKGLYGYLS
jgi:nicotinate-nucleotide adenylyltransferase